MCGITGYTYKEWSPPAERIREATETLTHRGPDQQGVFATDVFSFGATRLKVIDLETGCQPMLENGGEWGIVFNGEIFNYQEIRRELVELGHRFQSHSDTETVLKAFLQWDTNAFAKLRGMFAFAIWNAPAKRLVLARDRMGIKPLYYALKGKDIFFGSELKAILVHPEIERHLSMEGLECYLSLNYVPSPWTLIEGIKKVTPGEWIEWLDGKITREIYWTLPCASPRHISIEDATHQLDCLLEDSIREQLVADVPLGIWLSGGLDSTTILHYAAKACTSRLKTFSISFQGRSFDETRYIREAVTRYRTDHHEMDLNPRIDLRSAIEEFAYYSDEPCADAGALPVWFLSKLCKRETTVALSGEGADELFGGYLTHRANSIARTIRKIPGAASLGLAAMRLWPVSDEKIGFDYKATRLLEGSRMSPERAHVYWNGTFARAQLAEIVNRTLPHSLDEILSGTRRLPEGAGELSRYLWLDQKYYLADDILTKSDRMSMAHAVEVRPAFLDHRIVEFAASLPSTMKINGFRQKVILKELMKDKLPSKIVGRKKVGFDIPTHEWMRGVLRELLEESLRFGFSEYGDFFNRAGIEQLNARHQARKTNAGYHLWGLLMLLLWMKEWHVRIPATAQ